MNFLVTLVGLAFIAYSGSQRLDDSNPYTVYLMRNFSPKFSYPTLIGDSIEAASRNELILDPEAHYYYGKGMANLLDGFDEHLAPRSNDRLRPSTLSQRNPAQQRFIFSMLSNPNGFLSFLRPQTSATINPMLNPVVSTSTLTTTITTPVAIFCIPQTQFVTEANGAIKTTLCAARKRRSSPKELFAFEVDLESAPLEITASNVVKVETTKLPASIDDIRNRESPLPSTDKELISSKQETFDVSSDTMLRKPRQFSNLFLTTTSTQYVFTSTVFKRTLNLAAANQLSCLPSGIIIC